MDDFAPLSDAESERTWQRIRARVAARRTRAMRLVVVAAMATAAIVVAVLVPRSPTVVQPTWYEAAAADSCVRRLAPDSIAIETRCDASTLRIGADEVLLSGGAVLERVDKGVVLQLRQGKARFRVAARGSGARPFEVKVSGGSIVVLGTVFAVEQGVKQGSVALESGSIEFRWTDGSAPTTLSPGERLEWPQVARDTPAREQVERQAKPRDPIARQSAADIMTRQFQLRSQRRYDEVIGVLDDASQRDDFTVAQRARFSFELGQLLGTLERTNAACAHWRRHAKRFPGDEHRNEVTQALAHCDAK